MKKYFVTGATGAIGSALIPALLEIEDCFIWMLIRAESTEKLNERFEELIEFWGVDDEKALSIRRRAIPLMGDADVSKFGLSDAEYNNIAKQCTNIIHCAGVVKMNLPLDEARKHALGSAENIVKLSLACLESGVLQKVDYVSTVGVAGKMGGLIPENWINQDREFHNTYEQSKAEAEDYLKLKIHEFNLPVTVHRPSMVTGDSKTGKIIHYQIFYHICEFLSGRRTYGLMPYFNNARLDTVPVDYVSRVIASSSLDQSTIGKIFNLCSGQDKSIKLVDLMKIVRKLMLGKAIRLPLLIQMPVFIFNGVISLLMPLLNEKMQRVLSTLPYFLEYLTDNQSFDNQQATQYLEGEFEKDHFVVALKAYLDQRLS